MFSFPTGNAQGEFGYSSHLASTQQHAVLCVMSLRPSQPSSTSTTGGRKEDQEDLLHKAGDKDRQAQLSVPHLSHSGERCQVLGQSHPTWLRMEGEWVGVAGRACIF